MTFTPHSCVSKVSRSERRKPAWIIGLITSCLTGAHWVAANPLPAQKLTSCDEPGFRQALELGGTIQCDCEGTVVLSSELVVAKNTVIDCTKPGFTLSGNQTVRVLHVNPGVSLTLLNLKIKHGKSPRGGGLLNDGGQVTVSNCVFESNLAAGIPFPKPEVGDTHYVAECPPDRVGCVAEGGAVYSTGSLLAMKTVFTGNTAQGRDGERIYYLYPIPSVRGGDAMGGAICQGSGILDLQRCVFRSNRVQGGSAYVEASDNDPSGGLGKGGCVGIIDGEVRMNACLAEDNSALGGNGGLFGSPVVTTRPGGLAQGAVLHNTGTGRIRNCNFRNNQTSGGKGGEGFGASWVYSGGNGGEGGSAQGGGAYNAGYLSIEDTAWIGNRSMGGEGGAAGAGYGGNHLTFQYGGTGGMGGEATGAGIFNLGTVLVRNCTWAENVATAGRGGGGGKGGTITFYDHLQMKDVSLHYIGREGDGGNSTGGAVMNEQGAIQLINCTLAHNRCLASDGDPRGQGTIANSSGGGLRNRSATPVSLVNTLLAFNFADTNAANAAGLLSDLGYNLSSDGTCAWTRKSSRSQLDPKLGPLNDLDGPTPTLPLLPDSPARDSGSTRLGPATDQRGVVRPFGPATDIGAIEYENIITPEPFRLSGVAEGGVTLRWTGGPGIRIQHASSLTAAVWKDLTETVGKHAAVLRPGETAGYFRLHSP